MKTYKVMALFTLALFAFALLGGCSFEADANYNALLQQNEQYANEVARLEAEIVELKDELMQQPQQGEAAGQEAAQQSAEQVDVYVGGNFTASIWAFVPDFYDIPENHVAMVVSEFQSRLFVVYIEQSVAAQLEVGEPYLFEVQSRYYTSVPQAEYDAEYAGRQVSATELSGTEYLFISAASEPREDQLGLASPNLSYSTE